MVTDLLDSLLGMVGVQLPPWGGSVLLLGVLLLLSPALLKNTRSKQVRKLLQRLSLEGGDKRQASVQELLELAAGHPTALIVLVEEAHKRGQSSLAKRAVELLGETGKQRADYKRLKRLFAERPTSLHAEVLAVERLIDAGLEQQAWLRLDKALLRWPQDADLLGLRERLPER